MARFALSALLFAMVLSPAGDFARSQCCAARQGIVPATNAVALDGHAVTLPKDFSGTTIVIVGFSRNSADATTAWEIPVRTRLADARVSFYDVAVLESVPGFLRGWVVRSLRRKVPSVLQGRFLPVFEHEKEWKQACDFDTKDPDAACVLLAGREGNVLWRTNERYSDVGFAKLKAEATRGTPN